MTVWPRVPTVVGLGVLTRRSAGAEVTVAVAPAGLEVTGPTPAAVPEAVARLTTEPRSTSAWVVVYVAVQVVAAPGASVVVGQETALIPGSASVTPRPLTVVVPALVTAKR